MKYKVYNKETLLTEEWSMAQILEEINRVARKRFEISNWSDPDDFGEYDESEWVYGWNDCVEYGGKYSMVDGGLLYIQETIISKVDEDITNNYDTKLLRKIIEQVSAEKLKEILDNS